MIRKQVTRYARTTLFASALVGASLFVALSAPDVAFATIEGDQTPLSEEEIAEAIASGEILTQDEGADTQAISTMSSSFFDFYSGSDRIEVSAMEARAAYDKADCAILAGSNGWADALGSAGLAGILDCPILLTEQPALNDTTRQVLSDLQVSRVVIVGGPNTISPTVEQQLADMGLAVERVSGSDRYEVQTNIFNTYADQWEPGRIVIASGEDNKFADALSISPVLFRTKTPVFLVNGSGTLNDSQKGMLRDLAAQGGFSEVVIAGGPASVSSATESFAKSLALPSGGTVSVTRLGGDNRHQASVNIANWAVSNGILSWDGVALAMGGKPYDALCGSILQGRRGSAMLVVSSNASDNSSVYDALRANKGAVSTLRVFGGKSSIPMTIRMDVADIFGIPYYEIPGLKVYVDAGHGMNDSNTGVYDPGACANGYREAELNAELANMVSDVLRTKYGVDTYVNDDGGWYKLRHAEAQALGCDLIVSIHFNANAGSGTMTLIHSERAAARSWNLQDAIHPRLVAGTTLPDLGQRQQMVAILSGELPATLCEVACIDNARDMQVYQSRKSVIAEKIAEGVVTRS